LPAAKRDVLQQVRQSFVWTFPWLSTLPDAKDSTSGLALLAAIPAGQRFRHLAGHYMDESFREVLFAVAERESWREADRSLLGDLYRTKYRGGRRKWSDEELGALLDVWAAPEAMGAAWLDALKAYQHVFFAEEEKRIIPALKTAVSQAQSLGVKLAMPELLEELSQGLRFAEMQEINDIVMIPSFWITPLVILTEMKQPDRWLFLFGGRPVAASLVPGDPVPDSLFQALKALADPTRLRILRYLSAEPQTPAELARRLRLRPPTVIHHLDALRLARMVQLTIGPEGRRYAARPEAVTAAMALLDSYLNQDKG
jgi:DNA-binding transcriptional ArsR family regulator